jgi:DNA polymerase-3 subunit delta'
MLVRREGIEPEVAAAAARATQGHVDRARRLATDAAARDRRAAVLKLPLRVDDVGSFSTAARDRRAAVLKLPLRVDDVGSALRAAQELVDAAAADAKELAEEMDSKEAEELKAALGAAQGGRLPRGTAGVMKDLEENQKRRRTRTQRNSLDLALSDLTTFYRDVLALQLGSRVAIANADSMDVLERLARAGSPEATLRRIEAIAACGEALDRNVPPLLAVEAMTMALRSG